MTDDFFSKIRSYQPNKKVPPIENYAHASVLIIFMKEQNEWNLVLTKRTSTVSTHKGQVAFPGGAQDETDKNLTETALRETFEEIGIPQTALTVIGQLDQFFTISDYLVTPVIAVMNSVIPFKANNEEIDKIFTVPFPFFLKEENLRIEIWEGKGVKRTLHFWEYQSEYIWGLTADIIKHLIQVGFGKMYFEKVPISPSRQNELFKKLSAL